MTIANLLNGIKALLIDSFTNANIKFKNVDNSYTIPNIHIGLLPTNITEKDIPSVVIVPPTEAEDNGQVFNIPLKLLFTIMYKNDEEQAFLSILTLAERLQDILMSNNIVSGFRRTNSITFGVDALAGRSTSICIGELDVEYETLSKYREELC